MRKIILPISMWPITLVFSILIVLINSCTPSEKDLVGTYIGEYGKGVETIKIFPDGTYEQIFTRDGKQIYLNKNKWELRRGDELFFLNFNRVDANASSSGDKANYEFFNSCQGHWNVGEKIIIFGADFNEHWVTKKE